MPIAIIGLGKTGKSLAHYFARQKEEVWAVDDAKEESFVHDPSKEWISHWFLGGKLPDFKQVSRCFASPGVPPHHPALLAAKQDGLIIEEEMDLAFSLCKGQVIAITGTNGKSTTTALIGEILQANGNRVLVGGNFGTPFLELVQSSPQADYYVIEVSSFQLFRTKKFRPQVAVLLNVTEDHLEWHPNFRHYLDAKAKIFAFQKKEDIAIYNANDLHVLKVVETINAKKIPFSNSQQVDGAYTRIKDEKNILTWAPQGEIVAEWDAEISVLTGIHNLENITAAIACAKAIKVSDTAIAAALKKFSGLPHRLEKIAEINGVSYYDDSKATNVGATIMSLASFEEKVILILGGVDKGGDYSPLKSLIKAKVIALLVIGQAQEKIAQALKGSTELICLPNMEAAVNKAYELATIGSTVLLAPACSSFDQYKNYHERGQHFQTLVKNLVEK